MTRDQGSKYEQLAELFLKRNSCQVLERNFFAKVGEIDIIAIDNKTLIFVEVKFRKNKLYGGSSAAVTKSKQRKIIMASQIYLAKNTKYRKLPCRFDVICMEPDLNIEWVKNAFLVPSQH